MWATTQTAEEQIIGNGFPENYSCTPGDNPALPTTIKPVSERYGDALKSILASPKGGFDQDWKNAITASVYAEEDISPDDGVNGWGTSEIGRRIVSYFNLDKNFNESNSPFGEHILTLLQYKTLYELGKINSLDMLYIALHFITKEEKQNKIFEDGIIKKYAENPKQAENIRLVLDVAKAGYYEKIAANLPEDLRTSITDFIRTVTSNNGSRPECISVRVPGAAGSDTEDVMQVVNLNEEPELDLVYGQIRSLVNDGAIPDGV